MDHRSAVSWPHLYDETGIHTFEVLKDLGLKPENTLLDIGCGSLCSGRHFLAYLRAGNYHAVEPNTWLIEAACKEELGQDWPGLSEMHLYTFDDFMLSRTGHVFDFVLAHSIFTHATQAQVKSIMREARRVMHPGSVFAATYYWGSVDSDEPVWMWPPGVSYSHEFIRRAATECQLPIETLPVKHPAGHTWAVMRMNTLEAENRAYQDAVENQKDRVERFTEYVNGTPYLKAHRDFVEKMFYGFGERCFHWLWKLLVDQMPPEFRFLEIGVYCGQMLSLVPLIAREQGKHCQALGVTLLNTFSGEKGEFPPFPDVHYLEKIKDIHRQFDLPLSPQQGLIVGDSTNPEVHARVAERGPFDIAYVDGCHEYAYVESDLAVYGEMVKPGGYLVVDDASCHLHIPQGMFAGIEPVSRATEKVIVNHPEVWQDYLAVMHNRVFLRRN